MTIKKLADEEAFFEGSYEDVLKRCEERALFYTEDSRYDYLTLAETFDKLYIGYVEGRVLLHALIKRTMTLSELSQLIGTEIHLIDQSVWELH